VWKIFQLNKTIGRQNILSLVFENFSKMGLLKYAILIYAAILNYSKKKSVFCLYLKAQQNLEQLFQQI
jgi:hypothetical protein